MVTKKENYIIRNKTPKDEILIKNLIDEYWNGEPSMIHNKEFYPSKMDGILAFKSDEIESFLIYEIIGKTCEIIIFDVLEKFQGLGTIMLEELKKVAKSKGCNKLYLMTTNDNLDALRFYQRRGFTICGIHLNSIEKSRKKKPSIPKLGKYGIPFRDEIDLEMKI